MKQLLLFLILSFGCVQQNDIRFTDSKILTNKEVRKLYKNGKGEIYLFIYDTIQKSLVSVFKKDNTEHYKLIYKFKFNKIYDDQDLICEATKLKFLQDKKKEKEWKERIKKRNRDQIESTADAAADIVGALLDN